MGKLARWGKDLFGDKMTDKHDDLPRAAADSNAPGREQRQETRRRALARLGLIGLVGYSAPTVLRIDRSARAGTLPSECVDPPNFPPGFPPPPCP